MMAVYFHTLIDNANVWTQHKTFKKHQHNSFNTPVAYFYVHEF